jgi:hypothetical protein
MHQPRAGLFATTSRSILMLSLWSACAFAADPRPSTSRLLPARALTFSIEYDGLDAYSEAWKATSAYALIHRQPTGQMVADISKQVISPSDWVSFPGHPPRTVPLRVAHRAVRSHGQRLPLG